LEGFLISIARIELVGEQLNHSSKGWVDKGAGLKITTAKKASNDK